MSSVSLSEMLATIRTTADATKAKIMAEVKTQNTSLPTGGKLPSLAIANHAKAKAVGDASKALIEALQSGAFVVKGAGKVLKSGDASIRIGTPLASLKTVIADAQARELKARDARTVARFRVKFPADTAGKADAVVLTVAKAYAARVESEKQAAKATRDAAIAAKSDGRTTPDAEAPAPDSLAGVLAGLAAA